MSTVYVVRTPDRLNRQGKPFEIHVHANSEESARKIAAYMWGGVRPDECVAVTLTYHLANPEVPT